MRHFATVLASIMLMCSAMAAAAAQFEYAWPVAPGCTQRLERNPNFGNNLRLRANGTRRPHLGVDLAPPPEDLQVYAANKGVVVENSPARGSGWGNYLVIHHADGLRTLYGHLVTPSNLRVEAKVSKGDVLGIAGKTETSYVHVHFEVLAKSAGQDWTRGRLDPASLAGPLLACRNSAALDNTAAVVRSRAVGLLPEYMTDVTRAIQLALAPVFLLTGIAGLLNVMTNRLSRIIDRGRALAENRDVIARTGAESIALQLRVLERRRHFTGIAITACTIAALLLCFVVVTLFIEAMLNARLHAAVAVLFTGSTLSLIVGLAYFLREVHEATRSRIRFTDAK